MTYRPLHVCSLHAALLLACVCGGLWPRGDSLPSRRERGKCHPCCLHLSVTNLQIQALGAGSDPILHLELLPGNAPALDASPESASDKGMAQACSWREGYIRYSLTWFYLEPITQPAPKRPECRVLMVQLTGENTASEYANASATLSLRYNEQVLTLQLDGELVQTISGKGLTTLGALRVASEGIDRRSHSTQLGFRGHMPPGTSGAMSVRIPTIQLEKREDLEWLMDLEFEDELRRLHRTQRQATPR